MNLDGVKYTNLTASAAIKATAGTFYGFIVNSHTNGTVKFWDQTTAAVPVMLNTITLAAGPGFYTFPKGIGFNTALYLTIGGTADITVLWV